MYTISDIISDIDRGCIANNMTENRFSYRIIFFVNENGKGTKYYIDSKYGDLRGALESIIRGTSFSDKQYCDCGNNSFKGRKMHFLVEQVICIQPGRIFPSDIWKMQK